MNNIRNFSIIAQTQEMRNLQLLRNFVQGLLADQIRAQARETALVQIPVALVQKCGNDAIQDRVAEELHPFIVQAAMAAMGQGYLQQRRIAELIAQPVLQDC